MCSFGALAAERLQGLQCTLCPRRQQRQRETFRRRSRRILGQRGFLSKMWCRSQRLARLPALSSFQHVFERTFFDTEHTARVNQVQEERVKLRGTVQLQATVELRMHDGWLCKHLCPWVRALSQWTLATSKSQWLLSGMRSCEILWTVRAHVFSEQICSCKSSFCILACLVLSEHMKLPMCTLGIPLKLIS